MAKPWYFQVMGAEIGPVTSAELKEKVQMGQIQPDTLIRSGQDGKWLPADRWKGLLPAKEETPDPPPAPAQESKAAAPTKPKPGTTAATIKIDDEDDPLYHMKGEAAPTGAPIPYSHPDEYDFFQFVGFRHAITHPLYDALVIYSHQQQLTVTDITRRSIAKFIGRPELGQDKPPPSPDDATTEIPEVSIESDTVAE